MATPIQMYLASDGKVFSSEKEADAHSDYLKLAREFSAYPSQRADFGDHYKILMEILTKNQFSPRVIVKAAP